MVVVRCRDRPGQRHWADLSPDQRGVGLLGGHGGGGPRHKEGAGLAMPEARPSDADGSSRSAVGVHRAPRLCNSGSALRGKRASRLPSSEIASVCHPINPQRSARVPITASYTPSPVRPSVTVTFARPAIASRSPGSRAPRGDRRASERHRDRGADRRRRVRSRDRNPRRALRVYRVANAGYLRGR